MTASPLYLLDTNIISNAMRDPTEAFSQRVFAAETQDAGDGVCTSFIVPCELLFGVRRQSNPEWERQYQRVMASILVKPLDSNIAADYANLLTEIEQLGTPIGPNDTQIAAHALALGAILVSGDSQFNRVPGLTVENWLSDEI